MIKVAMSAPGKAVLCGEYAVLDGAPAIVMAVNRRARVSLRSSEDEYHRFRMPGQNASPVRFRFGDSAEILIAGHARPSLDPALISCVWRAVGAPPACSIDMHLDTRAFYDAPSGSKLGFGSSAALAVALTSALLRFIDDRRDPGPIALAAHRGFQRGSGSGVDIAAALHGGVMAFDTTAGLATEALQWPAGINYRLLWSGHTASTVDRLMRLEENAGTAAARASAGRLRRASEDVLVAWQGGDAEGICDTLRDYCGVLQQFSVDHNLGVFDAGHGEMGELASRHGLIYKPCGAGGGDVGIVLGTRLNDLEYFVGHAAGFGFTKLDVTLDSCGLKETSDR